MVNPIVCTYYCSIMITPKMFDRQNYFSFCGMINYSWLIMGIMLQLHELSPLPTQNTKSS